MTRHYIIKYSLQGSQLYKLLINFMLLFFVYLLLLLSQLHLNNKQLPCKNEKMGAQTTDKLTYVIYLFIYL